MQQRRRLWSLTLLACLVAIGALTLWKRLPPAQGPADLQKRASAPELPGESGTPQNPEASPSVSTAGKIDEAHLADKVIPELVAYAKRHFPQNPPARLNRFRREERLKLREGRLISLVHPELMERVMSRLAEDPLKPAFERYYAMYMLGFLCEAGRPEAKAALLRLASNSDSVTSFRAIDILYPTDRHGEYRELYMRKASEGVQSAFWPLSFIADSSSVAYMKGLTAVTQDGSTKAFDINFLASDALGKYETLMAPDWPLKLADTILQGKTEDEVIWALQAARRNAFPNLTVLLRQRLDVNLEQMKADHAASQAKSTTPENIASSFEQSYASQSAVPRMPLYYDDALLMQFELGGPLTDREKARLRTFGYGCDPKQRLEELLSTGR